MSEYRLFCHTDVNDKDKPEMPSLLRNPLRKQSGKDLPIIRLPESRSVKIYKDTEVR